MGRVREARVLVVRVSNVVAHCHCAARAVQAKRARASPNQRAVLGSPQRVAFLLWRVRRQLRTCGAQSSTTKNATVDLRRLHLEQNAAVRAREAKYTECVVKSDVCQFLMLRLLSSCIVGFGLAAGRRRNIVGRRRNIHRHFIFFFCKSRAIRQTTKQRGFCCNRDIISTLCMLLQISQQKIKLSNKKKTHAHTNCTCQEVCQEACQEARREVRRVRVPFVVVLLISKRSCLGRQNPQWPRRGSRCQPARNAVPF